MRAQAVMSLSPPRESWMEPLDPAFGVSPVQGVADIWKWNSIGEYLFFSLLVDEEI